MSVTLEKASDKSPYGGHNSQTSYTKRPDGMVPEYILLGRRYAKGGRVSHEWAYHLGWGDLVVLQMFYQDH